MPGEARFTIEWHDSGAHLVERSTIEMPEAPNGVSIMGCDAAKGTYYRLYSGDRGVADHGNTIVGRWEKAEDGEHYETDFDLIYRKIK